MPVAHTKDHEESEACGMLHPSLSCPGASCWAAHAAANGTVH